MTSLSRPHAPMREAQAENFPVPTQATPDTKSIPNGSKRTDSRAPARLPARLADGRNVPVSGGSLGSTAKYSAPTSQTDPDTGEIIEEKGAFNPLLAVAERYRLQSVARELLGNSRTGKCMRWRQKAKQIQVLQSKKAKSCHYSGLQTCGSVWACAVCTSKISERRRGELLKAMDAHKAAGGCMNLLTLTCPHQRDDNLVDLLAKQSLALKYMFQDKTVRNIFKEMGKIGQVRALETTNGRRSDYNNGWHPHYHVLQFCGVGVDLARFDAAQMMDWSTRLYLRWAHCCVRAGLGEPSFAHGLKLDDGSHAAKYVSKWGLENEMTKGHTKKASQGETPFDLLRAIAADPDDKQAAALFVEFAEAFKGKRQLHWSPGLKKHFGIGELTDEEIAAKVEDKCAMLGQLSVDQWRDVLRVDGRALVLQLAASGGWDAVSLYLGSIKQTNKETNKETNKGGKA